MNLPQGNPYKELLDKKMNDLITQAQLETEIAKDVANKPEMYAFEPIQPKPQKLMDFYTLSEEKQDKVWKNLQYDPEIMHYNRVLLEHDRNIYALKYFIDRLNDFPDEQLKLKQRLAKYIGNPEIIRELKDLSTEEQDVLKEWGGTVVD